MGLNKLGIRLCLQSLIALILCTGASAQNKKPLDQAVYDIWNRMYAHDISPGGNWIFLSVGPEDKDTELRIKSLQTDSIYRLFL